MRETKLICHVLKLHTCNDLCFMKLGNTALISAADRGHSSVVSLLLDRGATIDARNHVCTMRTSLKTPEILCTS